MMAKKRARGRPAAGSDMRSAIVEAARELFAASGYTSTTIRSIARKANVDPALVHHYFRTKRGLYTAVMALGDARLKPHVPLERGDGLRTLRGATLVMVVLEAWDRPETTAALAALIRSSAADAPARERLDALLRDAIAGPLAARLDGTRAMTRVRSALIAAQLVGLAWARYVARAEPLTSTSVLTLARIYGDAIDAVLAGSDFGAV